MKKIIIIISALLLGIAAVTWLYFKNLSSSEYTSEKVFMMVPADASVVFEYKNEASFYDIFKDFSLFKDIIGKDLSTHLVALKQIFVDDNLISPTINGSNLFFSLHQTNKNAAEILLLAPIAKDIKNEEELLNVLKSKYQLTDTLTANGKIFKIRFTNKSEFSFFVHKSLLIGSFDKSLLAKSMALINSKNQISGFIVDHKAPRNKNSIANLYINFAKLPDFLNNFSSRKNPEETHLLKEIKATASLNINYQGNAFMFSGITNPDLKNQNYFNLFLSQQPGQSTLINNLPYDAAAYTFYYVSDYKKFKTELIAHFVLEKQWDKLKKQLTEISTRHSINLDKELIPVIGNEFGTFQLASGDKLGIIKTSNANRLSFLLSTISSEATENIRHFDDSYLLEAFFGEPFKNFRRPYYAFIENHLIVANNTTALRRFLKNYNDQNLLNRTNKQLDFQQYLSNQGNIFFFVHNSNAKAVIKSFLSNTAYKDLKSENFDWKNIYGFAIQFSADKDKYFTNLYMNKMPQEENYLPNIDSLLLAK